MARGMRVELGRRRGRLARTSARSRPARVRLLCTKSLYDPYMRRTRASAPWMRFALAFVLALGAAVVSGAAQQFTILTNGQNLQIPINAAANRYETR